jgi:predicted permease
MGFFLNFLGGADRIKQAELMNFRHVFRRLLLSPAFTATALFMLAIGIGANVAIFSVLDNVLLKPLPYPKPDELVGVWLKSAPLHFEDLNMAESLYFLFRDENRTFSDIGLWSQGGVSVTGLAEPERVESLNVTERTLALLGVQTMLGRGFSAQDDLPGSPKTVLLEYGYWQSKFGGQPSAIGRRIMVDGTEREIIGVLPANFRFLDQKPALIVPFQFDRSKVLLGDFSYEGVARLRPGVTIAQANADVARMLPMSYSRFRVFPGFTMQMFQDARVAPNLRPFKQDLIGDIGNVLWVLMGTMGVVLLIACANVANLLLARAEGRQHELAIRAALGASSGQIAGELLVESMMLGLLAGAIGLGLAFIALRVFVAHVAVSLPRMDEISINGETLLFTLAISLLSGVLFGLVPVIKFAGLRVSPALRSGGRNSSQSREQHRARSLLVVVQVALALVLLISSGLMIRTFRALREVKPGFSEPQEVQTVRVDIPEAQVKNPEQVLHMQKEMLERVKAIPGVASAAALTSVPMSGNSSNNPLFAEDHTYAEGQMPAIRRFESVAPGLFETLGNPLVAGRDFTWTDIESYQAEVVVSENLARELWGEPRAAIGKRIRENRTGPWRTVIGVVRDSYNDGVNEKAPAIVYWPLLQKNFEGDEVSEERNVAFVIRSSRAGSEEFLKAVRRAVWSVDASIPLASVHTLQYYYDKSLARTSLALLMPALAGAMALLLGVVGIYGVISYSVKQRTREIGIRMAVGAQQAELTRMFVRHGLTLATIGVVVGLAVAFLSSRLMASLLFGVQAVDPTTYGLVALGLVMSAVLASYIPARQVSSVDPVESLRAE